MNWVVSRCSPRPGKPRRWRIAACTCAMIRKSCAWTSGGKNRSDGTYGTSSPDATNSVLSPVTTVRYYSAKPALLGKDAEYERTVGGYRDVSRRKSPWRCDASHQWCGDPA